VTAVIVRVFADRGRGVAQARCDCGQAGIEQRVHTGTGDAWPDAVARAESDAIRHGDDKGHTTARPLTSEVA
jgi:hypothetical protein